MLVLTKDLVVGVAEGLGLVTLESKAFINIGKDMYSIQVGNTATVTRIDVVGFHPPAMPGLSIVKNHGHITARINTRLPPAYVVEAVRALMYLIRMLKPVKGEWSYEKAPHADIDATTRKVLVAKLRYELEAIQYARRDQIPRAKKLTPMEMEYIANAEEYQRERTPEPKLMTIPATAPDTQPDLKSPTLLIPEPIEINAFSGSGKTGVLALGRIMPEPTRAAKRLKAANEWADDYDLIELLPEGFENEFE